jgi:hypothetical protein
MNKEDKREFHKLMKDYLGIGKDSLTGIIFLISTICFIDGNFSNINRGILVFISLVIAIGDWKYKLFMRIKLFETEEINEKLEQENLTLKKRIEELTQL